MKYTEYQLIELAQNNPQELVRIINTHGDLRTIASTVEILSTEVADEKLVLPVLLKLLKHIHATIRESAISGASSFYSERKASPDILEQLRLVSQNDPSSLLKDYAKDLLLKIE